MFYGGHLHENITCKKCGHRHPASWTCKQAADRAVIARGIEQPLVNADLADLELRMLATKAEPIRALLKLLHSYNPDLPMGAGMKAQFQALLEEIQC